MHLYFRQLHRGFITVLLLCFSHISVAEYIEFEPPFVVNLVSDYGIKFAQVSAQVRVNGSEAAKALKTHDPAIRHALVMLFSTKSEKDINSRQGKEQLRLEAVETIRKTLDEQHVKLSPIEVDKMEEDKKEGDTAETKAKPVKLPIQEVYFTRFIVQ